MTVAALVGLLVYAVSAWRNVSVWRGDPVARPDAWQVKTLLILGLACVIAWLAVIQFGTSFALSQARYYFPVVNAAALLAMLGLRTLLPSRVRPAGQGLFVGGLIALNVVIMTIYVLPFTFTVGDSFVNWTWGG